jgi:hypothetical protein
LYQSRIFRKAKAKAEAKAGQRFFFTRFHRLFPFCFSKIYFVQKIAREKREQGSQWVMARERAREMAQEWARRAPWKREMEGTLLMGMTIPRVLIAHRWLKQVHTS